jgi:hypothetical protein
MSDIVVVVATYGAVLSSVVFIFQLIENMKRMRVELATGVTNALPGNSSGILSLSGANISKRPISLTAYGLKLPDKRWVYFVNRSPDRFPTTLKDGEGVSMWAPLRDIASLLRDEGYEGEIELGAYFRDTSDKYYRTKKKLKFNINEWLQD